MLHETMCPHKYGNTHTQVSEGLRGAVVGSGDARWFSVGTSGAVGVDNPRAEASRCGKGCEQTASWWARALSNFYISHAISFFFFCFHCHVYY